MALLVPKTEKAVFNTFWLRACHFSGLVKAYCLLVFFFIIVNTTLAHHASSRIIQKHLLIHKGSVQLRHNRLSNSQAICAKKIAVCFDK